MKNRKSINSSLIWTLSKDNIERNSEVYLPEYTPSIQPLSLVHLFKVQLLCLNCMLHHILKTGISYMQYNISHDMYNSSIMVKLYAIVYSADKSIYNDNTSCHSLITVCYWDSC